MWISYFCDQVNRSIDGRVSHSGRGRRLFSFPFSLLDGHRQRFQMRYGTHSPHLSHRPFAHAGQVALDVLQALALCLGHAKHDEHQAHQTDTAKQPERSVGAEHPQQVGERFGHHECAGPVEGCGQRGGRASDFGWNKHTRNEDYHASGGGGRGDTTARFNLATQLTSSVAPKSLEHVYGKCPKWWLSEWDLI